jgi:hypothetical protein
MCEKCLEFGVTCNYDASIPDLQPRPGLTEGISIDSKLQNPPLCGNQPLLDMINVYLNVDRSAPFEKRAALRLDYTDLARLERFQSRTVLSMGTARTAAYFQKEMVKLVASHRFLMHMIQSVTASHDRFLAGRTLSAQSEVEVYHMSQGIKGFQHKLSNPVRPEDRDSLLVAATLVGVVTCFSLEASSVEGMWPLQDSHLSWLDLSDGKKSIWRIVDPLRPDSIWKPLAEMYERDHILGERAYPSVLSVFDHLLSDDDSSPEKPYHRSASYLITLLDLDCTDATWMRFVAFIAHVDPNFKVGLRNKDPWALLMLAYWYMKVCRGPWWTAARAILGGQAICLYLERYHSDDAAIQRAVRCPKKELDIARREGWGGFT